jgi:hypothetical protein
VQWEYRKITLNGHHRKGDDVEVLSEAGRAGWELVTIMPNCIAYLKRPGERTQIQNSQDSGVTRPKPKYRVEG